MSISDFADKAEGKEVTWTPTKEEAKDTVQETPETTTVSEKTSVPTTQAAPSTTPPASNTFASPSSEATEDILAGVMSKIADIGANNNFKLMLIGPPGQGKSSFLATAPRNLITDFEDGLISAKESPHGIANGVKAVPYTGFEAFGALIKGFRDQDPRLDPWNIYSLDTLSDLHKRFLQEVCDRDWQRQKSRNRYVPDTDQYTEVNERILRVVRALRDLPMDIIINSHSKTVTPKNAAEQTYADFSESLSNKVMAQMDIVGYLVFKKVENQMVPVLRTTTDGTIRCKTRIKLPTEIVNPTYSVIREAWEESKNK